MAPRGKGWSAVVAAAAAVVAGRGMTTGWPLTTSTMSPGTTWGNEGRDVNEHSEGEDEKENVRGLHNVVQGAGEEGQ